MHLFQDIPEAIENIVHIAQRCTEIELGIITRLTFLPLMGSVSMAFETSMRD